MRLGLSCAFLLLLLVSPAAARPRDEVMINVYRCAGHASTRVWLDCYYGAAQPQRAALGLKPAPPAQVALVTAPPVPGAPQDLAVRHAVILAATGCGSIVAERPWLDCYYSAANPVRSLLGLAPMAGPASSPPPRKDAGVAGGLSGKPGSGRMRSYTFDRNGFFTVVLDNGEVWHQLDGDSSVPHWFRKPQTYTVTITDGALGSHNLRVKGEPGSYRVRRAF
ncbi:MAG TPA: hypothetical protein VHC40_12545 [Rhizomicrobium sp.]|nr:hypothetical protein [Rhizomicrobium sp.]